MGTVHEIERAITKLPRAEIPLLKKWLDEFAARARDAQIAEDAASGRLEELYRGLVPENAGQTEIALGDFLDEKKLS